MSTNQGLRNPNELYNNIRRGTNVKATEGIAKSMRHVQRGHDADGAQVEDQHVELKDY